MHLLVVEDEKNLREGIVDLLAGDGHTVVAEANGTTGLQTALGGAFDVVLLDVMLPGLDGFAICRALRAAKPGLPILMLTARGADDDKAQGFGEGADDYVTKPFSARELVFRVRALGRRVTHDDARITCGTWEFDLGALMARQGERTVALTPKEVGVIRLLHRHRERVVSRAELLEQVWALPGDLDTRAIDMAISQLRKKLEADPKQPAIVVSVKGAGYRWGAG